MLTTRWRVIRSNMLSLIKFSRLYSKVTFQAHDTYYKYLVSFRNARYYLPEFENQAGCYYNCIFQQLVYKCLPKYISFQLRHSANARHCNATFGWLVWPVWQFVKSNKRACKCGHIRMKSFQAFLFIQVKFWYCENATKFEKKSPTIYSVGDVKTNWNIFQSFVEYLKFSLFR